MQNSNMSFYFCESCLLKPEFFGKHLKYQKPAIQS